MSKIYDAIYVGNTSYKSHEDVSWSKDAACKSMDPDLFGVTLYEEYRDGELTGAEWFGLQKKHFVEAEMACGSCPIKQACYDNATDDDRAFTFRGGRSPLSILNRRLRQHNIKVLNARSEGEEGTDELADLEGVGGVLRGVGSFCSNGHRMTPENTINTVSAKSKCKTCLRAREQKFRDKKVAARNAKAQGVLH